MKEELLRVLKENHGRFVSGEELAALSGLTRAAIWKQINHLREIGYLIDSAPHKGYQLQNLTTALHPFEIRDGLGTEVFGQKIYYAAETESTNNWAKTLAGQGEPEGTLVVTEKQTGGRGRLGRSWAAAAGLGLWFSMILRPRVNPAALAGITIMTAVSMAKAVKRETGIQPEIKWPNDLLYQGEKITGILAELNGEMDRVNYLVIGIGLNVNQRRTDFPPELAHKATSLKIIAGTDFDRKPILQEFLRNFENDYFKLTAGDNTAVVAYAGEHSATLGKVVTVNRGFGESISGRALELDHDGSLWLGVGDAQKVKIFSGEVIEEG